MRGKLRSKCASWQGFLRASLAVYLYVVGSFAARARKDCGGLLLVDVGAGRFLPPGGRRNGVVDEASRAVLASLA